MNEQAGKTDGPPAGLSGTFALGGELNVRRLGFGAMRITGDGIWGPPKDPDSAVRVLRRSVELGVNFIDTADSYGPNVSEELIAKALAPYPADLVVATKGGWNRPGPNQWTHDSSPKHLREAVEGSLKRLRVDRIDVYQLHTPDPVTRFTRRSRPSRSCRPTERFDLSPSPTSLRNTLSARGRSCLSSRFKTVIALPIANGIMSWSIASATTSHLFRGFPWQRERSQAWCWRTLPRSAEKRPNRWRWLGY